MPQQNIFEIYDGRTSFWQWDTGQKLVVLNDDVDQVHFSNRTINYAIIKEVYKEGNVRMCNIPDEILSHSANMVAYAYVVTDDGNNTLCATTFSVRSRPIPEDYTYEETDRFKNIVDKVESIEDLVEKMFDGAIFTSLKQAEEWAKDTKQAGIIISVYNESRWMAYIVENDYSIAPVSGVDIDVDNKSLSFREDVLQLIGFGAAPVGAQPYKGADGSLKWEVPSTEAIDNLQNDVKALQDIIVPSDGKTLPMQQRVGTLEEQMNGSGTGSVAQKIDSAIAALDLENTYEPKGENSKSIDSAKINGAGELVLTYKDGSTDNVGVVVGKDGDDGYSPVKGVDYFDGKDGYTPKKGVDYFDGAKGDDGISPVVNVVELETGYNISVTDKNGTNNITLKHGKDGDKGDAFTFNDFTAEQLASLKGAPGEPGAKGDKPEKGVDYFTDADIDVIVDEVCDALEVYTKAEIDDMLSNIDVDIDLDEVNNAIAQKSQVQFITWEDDD